MGLLYHLLFRINVGFFLGACFVTIFFLQILVQKFFFGLFFFLKVEQINFFLFEGVPNFT